MAKKFRQFCVVKKTPESAIITSFLLAPTDGDGLAPARPGQYLPLKIPSSDGATLRNYSLSCDVSETKHYRVTIKREAAPTGVPHAPDGVGSCYMHDQINEGDELTVMAPRGTFYLDEESTRPVILLSGGVGLTPMVSMLHTLSGSDRPVWFIHACENGQVHALREEVLALGKASNVTTHFAYRLPDDADKAAQLYESEGILSLETLQSILPLDDYDVYMCGPTPFMAAMYQTLQSLGVPKNRINYEFFGESSSLEVTEKDLKKTLVVQPIGEGDIMVNFAKSGITVAWDDSAESLLDLAEKAGLESEFSCRTGICNSCLSGLQKGNVTYFERPLHNSGFHLGQDFGIPEQSNSGCLDGPVFT